MKSVTIKSSNVLNGFFKVTHREARCCSGSWACSPESERVFSTDLYQQVLNPLKTKE